MDSAKVIRAGEPVFLLHRTTRTIAEAILAGGFRDAPAPPIGRSGVWLSDRALDIDPFLLLVDRTTHGCRWALAFAESGAFAGWVHHLVFDRKGTLTHLAPCWPTRFTPGKPEPPPAFLLAVRAALGFLEPGALAAALSRLEPPAFAALPVLRLAHGSQLAMQHGNGPQTTLLGVRFPDAAVLAPWEVPGAPTWREWCVPAALIRTHATVTLLAHEESDAALGPLPLAAVA